MQISTDCKDTHSSWSSNKAYPCQCLAEPGTSPMKLKSPVRLLLLSLTEETRPSVQYTPNHSSQIGASVFHPDFSYQESPFKESYIISSPMRSRFISFDIPVKSAKYLSDDREKRKHHSKETVESFALKKQWKQTSEH